MTRKTWKKGNLYLSYGRPSIQAHQDEQPIKDMDDVMYFYYDLTILQDKKTMLKLRAYDFPKVQNLHLYIDDIMNKDMEKAYLLEKLNHHGFERTIRYAQTTLGDSFGFDIEYFYKIERYDISVKQHYENEPKIWTEYVLTIGRMEDSKKWGGDNREEYGKCIMIKYLNDDDLLRLKKTSLDFCDEAIRDYNQYTLEYIRKYKEEE